MEQLKMYLPCVVFQLCLSNSLCKSNTAPQQLQISDKHAMNYLPWTVKLFKQNISILSVGDKRINLTVNKEFSFHALHHGETFLVSARYTF